MIEYCKFHVDANKKVDDKPSKSEDDIKTWDGEFVKVDQATLFDLILVSRASDSELTTTGRGAGCVLCEAVCSQGCGGGLSSASRLPGVCVCMCVCGWGGGL